jgi:hypothetical protein
MDTRGLDEAMKAERDEALAKFMDGQPLEAQDLSCVIYTLEETIQVLKVLKVRGESELMGYLEKLAIDAKNAQH